MMRGAAVPVHIAGWYEVLVVGTMRGVSGDEEEILIRRSADLLGRPWGSKFEPNTSPISLERGKSDRRPVASYVAWFTPSRSCHPAGA